MAEELSLPVHRHQYMPDPQDCPINHFYVDSNDVLYLRTLIQWARLGPAKEFLGPSPEEKRYLRKSLGIPKGTRLS